MLLTTAAWAEGTASTPTGKKNDPAATIEECKTVETACLGAGFKAGEWKSKNGLWANCVSKLAHGKDAGSLKVTDELTSAAKTCQEKRPHHERHHGAPEAAKTAS